jgi:hypothetical protein
VKGAAVDGPRYPRVPVHWQRRHVADVGDEVDDDDIVERLGIIFKDMPAYTPCPLPEYSAARPPNEVSSRTEVGY